MGKRKILVLVLVAILAMTFSGGSYAWGQWRQSNAPANHNAPDVKFIDVSATDNEASPVDVGDVTADIIDYYSIEVTITNGYPGYEAFIDFEVQNVGKLPARIKNITIENDHPEAVKIRLDKPQLKWRIIPRDGSWSTKLRISITGEADEDTPYTFTIGLNFVQAQRSRD